MKKALLAGLGLLAAALTMTAQDIFEAAKANQLAKVKALTEADGRLVQAKDASGRTPLHWASRGVHMDIVNYLIGKGADVNAPDGSRETPLHLAAQAGSAEAVRRLVESGADPAARNVMNLTPLMFAVQAKNQDIVKYLIAHGGDIPPELLDVYHSSTPIRYAIMGRDLEMVKLLRQSGLDIRHRTPYGETYLHYAAAHDSRDIAEYLIECGLEVDSVKDGGLTPLHMAALLGCADAARLLAQKGARLDIRSRDGGTPLHYAVAARNTEIADFLRRIGAKDLPREFPRYQGRLLGQKAPGTDPEPFAPEIFRDIYRSYSPPIFTPDGKEVFWHGYFMPGVGYHRIWWMREENGFWTAPERAPFSDFQAVHPALSPDGKRLYFGSNQPVEGASAADFNLWCSEKQPDGRWSQAKDLGSPPNTAGANEMLPFPAQDGTLYFKANRPEAKGTLLYRSKIRDGAYEQPVSLDALIDANGIDDCPGLDHIINYEFGGPRYAEITILFHKPDGRWAKPVFLGNKVHQRQGTSSGRLSPDGRHFFFVQNIAPYWVDASFIEDLRREVLKNDASSNQDGRAKK
jgi:ankyrin repeat protein